MCKIEKVCFDTLLNEGKKLDYALLYRISEVLLLPAEQLEAGHLDEECLEARIFSNTEEYHYFEYEGEKRCVQIKDQADEDVIDCKYKLAEKIKAVIKEASVLCVRNYIAYDGDGQAYIKRTRLMGVE